MTRSRLVSIGFWLCLLIAVVCAEVGTATNESRLDDLAKTNGFIALAAALVLGLAWLIINGHLDD